MKLLTQAIIKKLPPIYAQEGLGDDAKIHVKFFTPDSSWSWFATEGNPIVVRDGEQTELDSQDQLTPGELVVDWRFFGMVHGFEKELGYFLLSELASARGRLGLPIERDRWLGDHTLGDLKAAGHL